MLCNRCGSDQIKNSKFKIKTTTHFNHPLVLQTIRYQNQNTLRFAGDELLMNNQTRFNRLAKPYLIGKQHARRDTFTYFMGDIQLMLNNIDTCTHQAS